MDPYREPHPVDPAALQLAHVPRWRRLFKRPSPEITFRLLVVFLLANVVATSTASAVSLELQRRGDGREGRLIASLDTARVQISDLRTRLARERASATRNASVNRGPAAMSPPAPPAPPPPPAPASMAAMRPPSALDPVMRDLFENVPRASIFAGTPATVQHPTPSRDFALRARASGADVTVEDTELSDGQRARVNVAWADQTPTYFLANMDRRSGALKLPPNDSSAFRVLGLEPGDTILSIDGFPLGTQPTCSSNCPMIYPNMWLEEGRLTLEVLHDGARILHAYHWTPHRAPAAAPAGRTPVTPALAR